MAASMMADVVEAAERASDGARMEATFFGFQSIADKVPLLRASPKAPHTAPPTRASPTASHTAPPAHSSHHDICAWLVSLW